MFGDVSGVQCQAYSQLTSSFRHSFASTDAIKFALAVDSPISVATPMVCLKATSCRVRQHVIGPWSLHGSAN